MDTLKKYSLFSAALLMLMCSCQGFEPGPEDPQSWVPGATFNFGTQSLQMTVLDSQFFNHTELDTLTTDFVRLRGRLAHRDCESDCPSTLIWEIDMTRDSLSEIRQFPERHLVGKAESFSDTFGMSGEYYEYEVDIRSNEPLDSIIWMVNTDTSAYFAENQTTLQIPITNPSFLDCYVRTVDVRGNGSMVRIFHRYDEVIFAPYFDYKITPLGAWAVLRNGPGSHFIFGLDSVATGIDSVYLPLDQSQLVDLAMIETGGSSTFLNDIWYYDQQQPDKIDAAQIQLKGKPVSNHHYSLSRAIQQMRMRYVDDQGEVWAASDQQPAGSYISINEAEVFELNENGQQTVVASLDFRLELTPQAIPGSVKRFIEGSATLAIPVEE